jgi:hypothetical protein
MNVWDFAAQQPVAACIIAAFALAGLCVLAVYFAWFVEMVRDWDKR